MTRSEKNTSGWNASRCWHAGHETNEKPSVDRRQPDQLADTACDHSVNNDHHCELAEQIKSALRIWLWPPTYALRRTALHCRRNNLLLIWTRAHEEALKRPWLSQTRVPLDQRRLTLDQHLHLSLLLRQRLFDRFDPLNLLEQLIVFVIEIAGQMIDLLIYARSPCASCRFLRASFARSSWPSDARFSTLPLARR